MMISLSTIVVAAALCQAPQPAAQPLRAEDAVVVAEALRLRETVGDGVWPGFSDVDCPVVLQVEDREYLIGFPAEVEGFVRIETPEALGALAVQVGPRSNEMNFIASFWVHGSPAVVIAAPEALRLGPTEWTLKAAHEMFHVMQSRRGEQEKVTALEIGPADDASWQLDFPFPYADETAQRLIHLQAWPCHVGAREEDDAEARYAAGVALEAAAAMTRYLEASGAPERSAEYASFQAWKEGVALWVEREVARAAAEGEYQPSDAFAALEGYVPFEEVWRDSYAGQQFLAKHAGRAARSRTMFYHLGLAKAMLLERLDPGWKDRYFEPGVWLNDLLRSAAAATGAGGPPAVPAPAAPAGDATVRQFGAMREALREGKSEGRVGLASVVERPHAFAVGALAGLAGEITIVDGAVWTARVVDAAPVVSGPRAAEEDQATLLTVAHVEAWQKFAIEEGLSGTTLEAFIERAAAGAGIDTSQPFAFMIEGTAAEVAMHIIAGACPVASVAPDAAEPWRWAGEDADVTVISFFARDKHGVMTHHGTSVHAHAIATIDGRRVTGHLDRVSTGPAMTLKLPVQ